MKKLRIIALILAMLTLLSVFVSCKKDEEANEETTGDTTVSTEPSDTEKVLDVEDDLPETMDFGQRVINVLHRVEPMNGNEIEADGSSSNNVENAVYTRNINVQERLNCVINPMCIVGTLENMDEVNDKVYTAELSGSKEFDIAIASSVSMTALAYQGCLTDLNSLQYVNTKKDYWSQGFREALSVGETQYFVTGPMSLSYFRYMFVTLFNKDLFKDHGIPSLYETVEAGEWTTEKMEQLAVNFYFDYNGDGNKDAGDSYGYYTHIGQNSSMMDGFWECYELRIVQKAEVDGFGNNYYTYNFEGEKFVNALDGIIKLLKSQGTFASKDISDSDVLKAFGSNQSAMITTRLYSVESAAVSGMSDGYGIVPLPKRDATQDNYATSIQAEVLLYSIPNQVNDVEQLGAFLEAFGSESYKTVRAAYYDVALTGRYVRDTESIENLDLVVNSVFVDPINYYRDFDFGREHLRVMHEKMENTISGTIARYRQTIKEKIDTINQHYYDAFRAQQAS